MMNKIYSSAIIMALVSLVACNKEGVQTVGETLSANAYISPETKTDYVIGKYGEKAGVKVTWSEAEKFKAYYGGAAPVIFSKTAAGTSFTAESVPSGVTSSTKFTGLYGSKATLNSDGKIDIDFSRQNGEADNLAAFDVMTATSELKDGALSFAFKHNCAILRLMCVNNTKNRVSKVRLSIGKAQVSQKFACKGFSQVNDKEGNPMGIFLTFNLKTPIEAGSAEKGKGTVGYRYVMVPAIDYRSAKKEYIGAGAIDEFSNDRIIELSETKCIEAGKVYDVLCRCGAEAGDDGFIWGD